MAFGRLGRRLSGAGKRKATSGNQESRLRSQPVERPSDVGQQSAGNVRGAFGDEVRGNGPSNGATPGNGSGADAKGGAPTFLPVLLGAGETAYGMARSFYEGYRVPSVAIAQQVQPICEDSSIVHAQAIDGFATDAVFRDALLDFAHQPATAGRTLLLVPTENRYARLLAHHAHELGEYYVCNVAPASLMERVATKNGFYELCQANGLSFPAYALVPIGGAGEKNPSAVPSDAGGRDASIVSPNAGTDAGTCEGDGETHTTAIPLDQLSESFPLMFKPDDPDAFISCEFRSKKNAYELRNRAELTYACSMVAAAGFTGNFVVQRQVAGSFDALRSLTCYCDRSGQVRLVAQADVVLEQAAPWSIGHFGAVIAGSDDALASQVAAFLQRIGYRGFCNIDVKIDAETGTPQFLDFNAAPCDTSYLATAAGQNLARFLVNDLLGDAMGRPEGAESDLSQDAAASVPTVGSPAGADAGRVDNRPMTSGNDACCGYATLDANAIMLSKVPDSTLRQYARNLSVWPRAQKLMQDNRCVGLFLPSYDQGIKRKRAFRTDQHFHRREFADCIGLNHVND